MIAHPLQPWKTADNRDKLRGGCTVARLHWIRPIAGDKREDGVQYLTQGAGAPRPRSPRSQRGNAQDVDDALQGVGQHVHQRKCSQPSRTSGPGARRAPARITGIPRSRTRCKAFSLVLIPKDVDIDSFHGGKTAWPGRRGGPRDAPWFPGVSGQRRPACPIWAPSGPFCPTEGRVLWSAHGVTARLW